MFLKKVQSRGIGLLLIKKELLKKPLEKNLGENLNQLQKLGVAPLVVLESPSSNPTPILRNSLIESAFHLAEMIDGGQEGGGGRGIPVYANYCLDQRQGQGLLLQLERITGPIESISHYSY